MYVCKCIENFMDKEKVSFLRGNIDWDLYEKEYKKCEGNVCPNYIEYKTVTGTINLQEINKSLRPEGTIIKE
jgi:hypothetical protein